MLAYFIFPPNNCSGEMASLKWAQTRTRKRSSGLQHLQDELNRLERDQERESGDTASCKDERVEAVEETDAESCDENNSSALAIQGLSLRDMNVIVRRHLANHPQENKGERGEYVHSVFCGSHPPSLPSPRAV